MLTLQYSLSLQEILISHSTVCTGTALQYSARPFIARRGALSELETVT